MGEVPMREHSAALDEIYALRKLLAYIALGEQASLDMKSFPNSRRAVTERMIERAQMAARGRHESATAGAAYDTYRIALLAAGADELMTRDIWRQQRGLNQ